MSGRIYYEVAPLPGGDDSDGWNVTRDGHVITWHATQVDAIIDAVQQAVDESSDGQHTGLRIKDRRGRIRDERTYPRSSDPVATKG